MRYKSGLVLGKYFGLHKGHKYLIDTSIENCDVVHIVVCYNSSQYISGEDRISQLKSIYKGFSNVHIIGLDDTGLPQHDYECESKDKFYSYWVPKIKNIIPFLDVVFTSEDYGDDFAKYLGIDHYLVDKLRIKYPISGKLVRSDPFKYWNFIPDQCKSYYVKKIAFLGPESVGKSILSQNISNYFNTNFVIEYGRTFYESRKGIIELDDFIHISKERQSLEDWNKEYSNKLLFLDTEDIITYIFSKMYCPETYKKHEEYFLERIRKHKYDLYILLRPDCDAVQDGTRNFLNERWSHFKLIKNTLIELKVNFIEVGGSWDNRYEKSIEIVKSTYNI